MGTLHSFPAKVSAPVQNPRRRGWRYPQGVTSIEAERGRRLLEQHEGRVAQQMAQTMKDVATGAEEDRDPRAMLASLNLACVLLLRLSKDCREALELLADE